MADDPRDDEQLMAAYVAGDEQAFRALFDRYAGVVFRLVRRRMASEEEARDIVQQSFLQMHRARHDFRTNSRLRPWLFTIALNLVREHYRRQRRRSELGAGASGQGEPAPGPETPIEDRERIERVRAALATLPDNQREVIELHWFGDSPYEEIAAIVGASVAAVRVRAHRGYERLRKILPQSE